MWVTYVIAGAFFVAFIAVGYFGVKEREDEAERERARLPAAGFAQPGGAPRAPDGSSMTSDQVVFELEHRIDEELRDISHALHAPERYSRIFEA